MVLLYSGSPTLNLPNPAVTLRQLLQHNNASFRTLPMDSDRLHWEDQALPWELVKALGRAYRASPSQLAQPS